MEQGEQILGQKRTFLSSTLPCVYFKGELADSDLKRYTLSRHVREPQFEDFKNTYYVIPQPQSSVTHIEKVQDSGDGRLKINYLRNDLLPSQSPTLDNRASDNFSLSQKTTFSGNAKGLHALLARQMIHFNSWSLFHPLTLWHD